MPRDRSPAGQPTQHQRPLSARPKPHLPSGWLWFVDEAIPGWVKQAYAQKESWKSKPFTDTDARFYFRGIQELSELFTEERPREIPPYFRHPKFRSSYLLYFLPLQAAKFLTVFELHSEALEAAWRQGQKTGTLRVLDLGAGPGTASLALLLWIVDRAKARPQESVPRILLEWFDTNGQVMEDGKGLAERIASHFPALSGKVSVRTQVQPWWKAAERPRTRSAGTEDLEEVPPALILLGNVLNESPSILSPGPGSGRDALRSLVESAGGGGVLMVEPAFKRASQLLSQIRDQLLEEGVVEDRESSFWGPCLHAGRCPLAAGRDWCHFSVPIQIPGRWFKQFSQGLGSERQWVKFSYLWLSSAQWPTNPSHPSLRRVVSDPIRGRNGHGPAALLVCEPEQVARISVPSMSPLRRGDVIDPARLKQFQPSSPQAEKPRSGHPRQDRRKPRDPRAGRR